MALLTAMLVTMLVSSLLVGVSVTIMLDLGTRSADRERTQAFYAAQAGTERLTADLGNLFAANYRPTASEVTALTNIPPSLPGVSYAGNSLEPGYSITFPTDASGNPLATNRTIESGPFQGLIGLLTPYRISVTALTAGGGEARVTRSIQTVGIPSFQFGIFSDFDLSFFAGPSFNFGGRVHTNGNLFLAEGNGNILTLSDRVTALGEVVRTNLSNGWQTAVNYTGTVNVLTSPGVFRALQPTEGSVQTTAASAQNEPLWTTLSIGTYNGNIRNGRTGARRLELAIVRDGATPVDLIRRPATGTGEPVELRRQRYFSMASLRIILSDAAANITTLPTVTATAPVDLLALGTSAAGAQPENQRAGGGACADGAGNARVNCLARAPFAQAGPAAEGYRIPEGTPLSSGMLKIEAQLPDQAWRDVTLEILNEGLSGRNLANGTLNTPDVNVCTAREPNPSAIIRLQRIRDNPTQFPPCGVDNAGQVTNRPTDYWPNVLFDTREGDARDGIPQANVTMPLGGVMHYVELDVLNLSNWLRAQNAGIMQETGYVVYFSDRRTNRNALNQETGEYGFEDFVNPGSPAGTPNQVLDAGEDVNRSGALDMYGKLPVVPAGATAPLDGTATPQTEVTAAVARQNRPLFFRRALKIVNGRRGNILAPGLTIVSENPVYVQGDFNAITAEGVPGTYNNPHAATSIIADSVSVLSNAWNDIQSFNAPHNPAQRVATSTTYRMAVIAGSGLAFPQPTAFAAAQDFGTDGGIHNFLRFLERWNGQAINFRGAIAILYANRQGVGVYKCCTNVYEPPARNFAFDTDFLNPNLLPPRTPLFRDVNSLGFSQVISPTR